MGLCQANTRQGQMQACSAEPSCVRVTHTEDPSTASRSPSPDTICSLSQGALPAFLSPAAVSAAYSSSKGPASDAPVAGSGGSDVLQAFQSPAAVTAYANGSMAPDVNAAENAC